MAKEQSESAGLTDFIQRLFRDASEPGTAEILEVTPPGKGRWQKCKVTAVVESEHFGPTTMTLDYVMHRDHWPQAGTRFPADVHIEQPDRTEILWPNN